MPFPTVDLVIRILVISDDPVVAGISTPTEIGCVLRTKSHSRINNGETLMVECHRRRSLWRKQSDR